MKMRHIHLTLIVSLVGSLSLAAQPSTSKELFCDDHIGHVCWYDGKVVDGWGNIFKDEALSRGNAWISEDGSINLQMGNIALRCIKRFDLCILHQGPNNIELLTITRWGDQRITARSEHYDSNRCVSTSYVVNRGGPVERIDDPGPEVDSLQCGTASSDLNGRSRKTLLH